MKRILLSLLGILWIGLLSSYAEDSTTYCDLTINPLKPTSAAGWDNELTFDNGVIKIYFAKNGANNAPYYKADEGLRLYPKNKFRVEVPGSNYKLKELVFVFTTPKSSTYCPSPYAETSGEVSNDGNYYTWKALTPCTDATFTCNFTSGQFRIKGVSVTYEKNGETVKELGVLKYNEEEDVPESINVYQGTALTFSAINADKIEIFKGENNFNEKDIVTSSDTSSLTWTPGVCDATKYTVIATMSKGEGTAPDSKSASFTLTVEAKDFSEAHWTITGGGSGQLHIGANSAPGSWSVEDNYYLGTGSNPYSGAQLGKSGSGFGGTLTLHDSKIPVNAQILSVTLTGQCASGGSATWDISLNEKHSTSSASFKYINTTTIEEKTIDCSDDGLIGNKIVLNCTSAVNAFFLQGITITYKLVELELGELTATNDEEDIEPNSTVTIEEETAITFHCDNAESISVKVNNGDDEDLHTENSTATWTPEVCENAVVTVTASLNDKVKTLNFTLTVTAKVVEIGEIKVMLGDTPVEEGNEVSADSRAVITIEAENATAFTVQVDDNEDPIELTADNGRATWTPGVMNDAIITITATREGSASKEFYFGLSLTEYVAPKWVAVTKTSQLRDGDIITFAAESKNQVMDAYESNSKGETDGHITVTNYTYNTDNLTFDVEPLELQLSKNTDNTWLIHFDKGDIKGYIYPNTKTSNNHVLVGDESEPLTHLTITINTNGTAEVKASDGNKLQYNATSPRFAFYTSNQTAITMYRRVVGEVEPALGEITFSCPTHFILDEVTENEEKVEVEVMEVTDFTFSCENATKLTFDVTKKFDNEEKTDIFDSSKEENPSTYSMVLEDEAIWEIIVMAENSTYSDIREFLITTTATDDPAEPYFMHYPDDNKLIIMTESGTIKYKIEYIGVDEVDVDDPFGMSRRIAGTDTWIHPEGIATTSHEINYSDADSNATYRLDAQAITAKSESDVKSVLLQNGEVTTLDEDTTVLSIKNVSADTVAEGEAIYYDLQGRRVEATTPGIYIKHQGSKVSKVAIH